MAARLTPRPPPPPHPPPANTPRLPHISHPRPPPPPSPTGLTYTLYYALYYAWCYNPLVATLTIRTDEQTERALAELTEDGTDRSAAVRAAIMAAARHRRAKRLRAEARALADDPDDRAEMAAVR